MEAATEAHRALLVQRCGKMLQGMEADASVRQRHRNGKHGEKLHCEAAGHSVSACLSVII
jgi:hypothetical protein